MEKSTLKIFASGAKSELERQISQSLKLLGINSENNIKTATLRGDVTVIEGNPTSYEKDVFGKRKQIVDLIKREGFDHTVEELSYTWFNRLIALRFMEVHDYLPHGFRVLSSKLGGFEPDIIKNLPLVAKELALNVPYCQSLKEKDCIEELYRYVLFQQCKSLASILPMLFCAEYDFLELLLPKTLLKGETIITKLVAIPESNFLEDVEVIGWLYQFYISAKKTDIFARKKTITKDEIPAVTQLFTPDWIVRYMTENSLGRLWTEARPNSSIKQSMKYYVEDSPQEPGIQKQLEKIRYRISSPTEITVLDPCCGSGHILVYAFDLLKDMYLESGYSLRDIPSLILQNNLIGFDIDKRASQLASFALTMKALKYDSKFFEKERIYEPKIFEIVSSKSISSVFFSEIKSLSLVNNSAFSVIEYVRDLFRDAKELGSLIIVEKKDYQSAINQLEAAMSPVNLDNKFTIFSDDAIYSKIPQMIQLLKQAIIMSTSVDVMITNPPYLPISDMEEKVKEYANKYYPASKTDMYAMFMETNFTKQHGFLGMVNMNSWMFLSSYEKLREMLIKTSNIVSMLHLGPHAFDEIGGEVVQTTAFVIRKFVGNYNGKYFRLVSQNAKTKEELFLQSNRYNNPGVFYTAKTSDFKSIPGSPIVYWAGSKTYEIFAKSKKLSDYYIAGGRNKTHNNEKYVRLWWEIGNTIKWQNYAKGGEYRKWYGNVIDVVNWSDEAKKEYDSHGGLYNQKFAQIKGVCWTLVTTNNNSFRVKESSDHFDSASPVIFNNSFIFEEYTIAFLNSIVATKMLKMLNPTLNTGNSYVLSLPYIVDIAYNEEIISMTNECISISKNDWDSYEISRSFKMHPFMESSGEQSIEKSYTIWEAKTSAQYQRLKTNEEEMDHIFRKIYGLCEENGYEIEGQFISSVQNADSARDCKSLLSYFIGIIMGRYSLSQEGLVFVGGVFDDSKYGSYQPAEDGIVPLFQMENIKDDLTNKIMDLVMITYGASNYKENLDFIAKALERRVSESAYDTIHRYLLNDFYTDHLKIYQKRPIYWMFSSGKNNAFQALVYLHRYDENTLANINKIFYLHSYRIKNELDSLETRIQQSIGNEKIKLERLKKTYLDHKAEMDEYGEVLAHKALEYLPLDLDDGVKVNYEKLQNVEIATNSGVKVTKNLLIPIK